jgi:hypothetical protein
MSARLLARSVWCSAERLPFTFGSELRPFSTQQFKEHHPDLACGRDSRKGEPKKNGWYWIGTDLSDAALKAAQADVPTEERQSRGSGRYVSIGERATGTLLDIGSEICAELMGDHRVVDNGHEEWARGRLGGHYESLDPRTGALRLSQHAGLRTVGTWSAAIFTEDRISRLEPNLQPLALRMVSSELGRTVVEMEWRSALGWPLLCCG